MAFETTKQVKFVASVDGADRVKAGFKGIGDSMGGLQGRAAALRSSFGALGGVALVAGFVGMVRSVADAQARLYDLGVQTGISVEQLSGLNRVAQLSGTEMQQVASASAKMNKALNTSGEESRGAAQGLKALGLDFKAFKALNADEQMLAIAKALEGFADGTEKTTAAMLLLGKNGAELLPFLKELAERGITPVKSITTDSALAAKAFSDNLTILKQNSEELARTLVNPLLPAVNDLLDAFNNKGFLAAMSKLGDRLFDFKGTQFSKQLSALQDDMARLQQDAMRAGVSVGELAQVPGIMDKAREIQALRNAFLGITDGSAGGGRGVVNPAAVRPRLLVPDMAKPVIDKSRLDAEKLQRKQVLDFIDQQREAEDELTRSIVEQDEKKRELLEKDVEASRRALAQAQLEFESYGLLQSQVAELTLARLRDKLAATEAGSAAEDAVRREIALQEQLIDVLRRGERRDEQFRNDPLAGANRAVKNYLEEIQAAGLATERAVGGAIRSLEDGLVQFVTKGKLDVRSLIDAMIAEFFRLQVIRPLLQGLFSSGGFLGGLFGGGGGVAPYAGGFDANGIFDGRASGGPVAAGGTYLVGERGPELLRMGANSGSIIPNGQIGRSVAVEYKPTIVIDSRTDRNEVRQLVAASVQQGNRQLVELMKSRGVFA